MRSLIFFPPVLCSRIPFPALADQETSMLFCYYLAVVLFRQLASDLLMSSTATVAWWTLALGDSSSLLVLLQLVLPTFEYCVPPTHQKILSASSASSHHGLDPPYPGSPHCHSQPSCRSICG